MWDERYSTKDYVYGTQANDFLAMQIAHIPKGQVLSLAEGEGRNAVYLAQQGYTVTAVDASQVGLDKAQRLADKAGVSINCVQADLAAYDFGENQWDAIISIFCPLPPNVRRAVYQGVERGLKPGGIFLLEAYTPEQLQYGTGGGSDITLMQTKASLSEELSGLCFQHLIELEREVIEGIFHTGKAAVVQAIAKKP